MLFCYICSHSPGKCIVQSYQSSQVVPMAWVVPWTGSQQTKPHTPAELPQVDENSVEHEPHSQWVILSEHQGPQPLHEIDCCGIHGQRPQTAVACQPPVLGAAPVPHRSEGHLAEAAMQRIHVETNKSRNRSSRAAAMWFCWGVIFNNPCQKETEITGCFRLFFFFLFSVVTDWTDMTRG